MPNIGNNQVIGHLKLTPTGIIARSGFKYIRFDPPMSILPQREVVVYKDEGYEFQDNVIHVSFADEHIKKETMSAVVLSDCTVLNRSHHTGKCTTRKGERSIVLTEDFKLAPIVSRRFRGPVSDRNDLQAYSSRNYIRFQVSWDRHGEVYKLDSSLADFKDRFDELWNKFKELYPDLGKFLTRQKRSASNVFTQSVCDRHELNKDHFRRFKTRYKSEFLINYDVDMDKFKSMDVIDLTNIQEIRIDNEEHLKNYAIYEILPNTIVYRGTGFSADVLDGLLDRRDKFYVMLVDNSIEHRIRKHTYATLYINTKILVPDTMTDQVDVRPEMVFLKFNRIGLKRWLANNIISNL